MLMRTAVLTLIAAAGLAHAQMTAPTADPAPTVTPNAAPQEHLTLIKQDPKTGMVLRLETTPEEAALALVSLSADERAAVDKILAERAAIVERTASANIGTVLKAQGFRRDDTNNERMQALVELRKQSGIDAFDKQHGALLKQIEGVIAPEKAATVRKLVTDYRTAIQLQNEATFRTSKEKDEQKRMAQIRGMETMLAFGLEVRRGYERHITAKETQLDDMLTTAQATPEQTAKVQALRAEYAQAAGGQPTVAQRRDFFQKVFQELNDRQKVVLLSDIYGVKAPEPKVESVAAPVGAQPTDSYTIKYASADTDERSTPEATGAVTSRVTKGQAVKVYEVKGEWARVTPYEDSKDGKAARWVLASTLSVEKPGAAPALAIKPDPRVVNLPMAAADGLTERDVLVLHAGARYFVESGKAESVTGGRKGSENLYYLLVGPREVPFTTSEIPDLEKRIEALRN